MGLFDGSNGGKFDPFNWIDYKIYNEMTKEDDEHDDDHYDDDYDDYDDDLYEDEYDDYDDDTYNDNEDDELDYESDEEIDTSSDSEDLDNKDDEDDESEEKDDEDDSMIEFKLSEDLSICVDKNSLNDKGDATYYTNLLLNKFPELNKEYKLYDWFFKIIEDKVKQNDYDNALKYYQYLVDNLDYEYISTKDDFFVSHLTFDIVFMLIENVKEDNMQQLADFLLKNTELFNFCFKKYQWNKYRPERQLRSYMQLFESVGNLEHVKLAYNTFLEYQKNYYTIDSLIYMWGGYWGLNHATGKYAEVKNKDFYIFYKNILSGFGEKSNKAMELLEWTITEGVERNRAIELKNNSRNNK